MINKTLNEAIDKIFSLNSNLEDIKTGLTIKNQYCPRKIYKYRALSEYSVKNVINENIWFDNPLQMNDPYDCRFKVDELADILSVDLETYNAMCEENSLLFNRDILDKIIINKINYRELFFRLGLDHQLIKDMIQNLNRSDTKLLNESIPNYLREIFFCSFSEKNNSTLMWSHYTLSNRGFCIEYDFYHPRDSQNFIDFLFPISYQQKLFKFNKAIFEPNFLSTTKNPFYIASPLIFKSNDWAYECEWRAISPLGLIDKANNMPTPLISSIFLGSQFFKQFELESKHKNADYDENHSLAVQLINHCKKNDIVLKIMKHSLSTYTMTDIPISYDECFKLLSIDS